MGMGAGCYSHDQVGQSQVYYQKLLSERAEVQDTSMGKELPRKIQRTVFCLHAIPWEQVKS